MASILETLSDSVKANTPDLIAAAKNSVIAKLPGALAGNPVVVSPGGVVSEAGQPSPVKQTDAAFWTPGKVALAVLVTLGIAGGAYYLGTR